MCFFLGVQAARKNPGIGLTDASLLVLAARLETTRIATLDERHFRVVLALTGEAAFTLLPADVYRSPVPGSVTQVAREQFPRVRGPPCPSGRNVESLGGRLSVLVDTVN